MVEDLKSVVSPKFVVIGGGTGSFTLLTGLRRYAQDITALVNMVDDGGSTGQLRDEYGVLPPGDVRQCLVALSESDQEMRELFNYRFREGSLDGHSFGNIFLAAVEKMTDNFADAVRIASDVLNVQGKVVPITLTSTQLVIENSTQRIVGQHAIDTSVLNRDERPKVYLSPECSINPDAREAILQADMVILAPGSLYDSLIGNLVVGGVREALEQTSARVVQVVNLVTKPGQTDDWLVSDFVTEVSRYVGEDTIDYVLYNTLKPTKQQMKTYAHDGEFPVAHRLIDFADKPYTAIGAQLLSLHDPKPQAGDKLGMQRSFIRHDPDKLARALMGIYFS